MTMPLAYRHHARRPVSTTASIIPTSLTDAIGRIIELLRRRQNFNAGVDETGYFPFSSICRLTMRYPGNPSTYQGSGFYIADDLILTAGHNLLDNGNLASSIRIQPGYNERDVFPAFTVGPDALEVHPQYRDHGNVGFDMGVIHVTQGPPGGHAFTLIDYSPIPNTPLAVSGYGLSDVASAEKQHLDIATFRSLADNGETLVFDIFALGGNSGSPCFVDFSNDRSGGFSSEHLPVMAILQGGPTDLNNRGVLLTPDKIDWARGGGRMSVAQSLGAPRASVGGLPLVQRSRATVGGLPLMPARMQPATAPAMRPAAPRRNGNGGAPALAQGFYARPMARAFIVVDRNGGMSDAARTFGHPSDDLSGRTTLRVSVPNLPSGGSVRWNIPDAGDRGRTLFEVGGSTSQSADGMTVTLLSLDAGVAHVDCMVKDTSGTIIESNKYLVCSPQFVFVALHSSVSTFLAGLGLASREADIIDEMKEVVRAAFDDVNIRFVFPGDTLPGHLGLASDPAFPGGVHAQPSVYYAEVIADDGINDPERTRNEGTPRPYRAGVLGRHHAPGEMNAPLDGHSLSRSLLQRYALIPEVGAVEAALGAGGLSGADMDLAATMYGRLLGENLAHEVGHFAHGTFFAHTGSGLTEAGGGRSFEERTGMAPGGGAGPILIDNGRGNINPLSADARRAFENVLPVHPPLDIAEERSRGRVGSFALGVPRAFSGHPDDSQILTVPQAVRSQSWVNPALSRPMEGETVHLPGATVLEGWKARALIIAIETGIRTAMSANPGLYLASFIFDLDDVLDLCDGLDVTLGFGAGLTGALGAGGGAGGGIVFAPGRRIGFYGSLSGVAGHVYSAGVSAQLTVVRGGPESFGGNSYTAGVTVETIGWFDAGTIGAPVGAHVIFGSDNRPIGITAEVGVSAGLPVVSLIEVYGQAVHTETTFSHSHALSRTRSVASEDPYAHMKAAAVAEAVAAGASPADAAAFADQLFT